MNFLHLKYLIEVEKYESISKAAQHLYINQPRLSKIIKEIEEEANIKIFERHNKGVVPTTKGREFLSQAKKIVQEVDYLKNMYQDDPHKLNLDICVPRSSYISEAFIEYLKMDNNMKKKLNLNYRETNSFDTIQNVYDGENNLGIVRFPLRDQDYYFNILNLKELTYEKLFTFDYQILISKDNPIILTKNMVNQIAETAHSFGYSYEIMPSGAGHDAMHMATLCPTGMIFVPSHLGISHNPLEFTDWKDIEAGIKVLQKVILEQAEAC